MQGSEQPPGTGWIGSSDAGGRHVLGPLMACALALTWPGSPRAENLEYAVKATFLYKFAPFVDWPRGPAPPAFILCVQGDDPFGPVLDRAVEGQRIEGRPVVVRRIEVVAPGSGCQVAFLAGSHRQSVLDALRALRGAPVLTVTDGEAPHGVIHFRIKDNRVRFDVDQVAADEAGLGLSSKLLNLALSVRVRR